VSLPADLQTVFGLAQNHPYLTSFLITTLLLGLADAFGLLLGVARPYVRKWNRFTQDCAEDKFRMTMKSRRQLSSSRRR
jgi:hypothetical protein